MMAVICVLDHRGTQPEAQAHAGVCVAIDVDDDPLFLDLTDPDADELFFKFVPTEEDLEPGKWTWKERV